MAERVVLGLSGGVDSSLCAALLRERGFEVHGLFLSYKGADPAPARQAAQQAGIGFSVLDITEQLEHKVIRPFCQAYQAGITPIPCVLCNPEVKFKALFDFADQIGARFCVDLDIAHGIRKHQMDVKKSVRLLIDRLDKARAEADIGHKMTIHVIKMKPLYAKLFNPADVFTQAEQICAQHRGRNLFQRYLPFHFSFASPRSCLYLAQRTALRRPSSTAACTAQPGSRSCMHGWNRHSPASSLYSG